jgi:hypothetical protein
MKFVELEGTGYSRRIEYTPFSQSLTVTKYVTPPTLQCGSEAHIFTRSQVDCENLDARLSLVVAP